MLFEKIYSYENYNSILGVLGDHGYQTRRFDQPGEDVQSSVFLRHDIDLSPVAALKIAEIENARNQVANFFFHINAETYQCLSTEVLGQMQEISSMGHLIGLHLDQTIMKLEDRDVRTTIDWFSEVFLPVSNTVSFHRPMKSLLGKDFESFQSVYAPRFFDLDLYCSDASRNFEFFSKLEHLINGRRGPIQWLTHPGWWEPGDDLDIFNLIRNRRSVEIKKYLHLNFRKVFGAFDV